MQNKWKARMQAKRTQSHYVYTLSICISILYENKETKYGTVTIAYSFKENDRCIQSAIEALMISMGWSTSAISTIKQKTDCQKHSSNNKITATQPLLIIPSLFSHLCEELRWGSCSN